MIRYIDHDPQGDDTMHDWRAEFGTSFTKARQALRRGGPPFGRDFAGLRGPHPHGGGGRRGFGEAERGSIKYDILGILWDGPRHGYDIMLTIEEQRGFRPSPGSVYPALQMLEEGDFLTGQDADKGSELLAKYREAADGGTPGEDNPGNVALIQRGMQTMMGLKSVLKEIARTRNPKLYARALTIIEHARRDLYELLSAD
jgi:hypothetical protein